MLTNLNWLNSGAEYPPAAEKDRIESYKANEKLFRTKHSEVYKQFFEELTTRLHLDKADKIRTILNYHQLLSKKTADFVCSEPPTIETEDDTDELSRRLEKMQWARKLYEGIIDISRYGNAVFKFVGQRVSVVDPKYWFPIVDPADLKEIVKHVIAYPTETDSEGKPTKLYVEIHDIGSIETRLYKFDSDKSTVGELLSVEGKPSDISEEFEIPGDDGIYDSGSDWTSTDVDVTIHEIDLSALAVLAGCDIDETKKAIEEGTLDIPQKVCLVYRALRRDGGYRCYRYYNCELTNYSVNHNTRGSNNDGQPYTLTFKCTPRAVDGKIRGTADVANLAEANTWLASIPTVNVA